MNGDWDCIAMSEQYNGIIYIGFPIVYYQYNGDIYHVSTSPYDFIMGDFSSIITCEHQPWHMAGS